ncbi:MAG: hypothetical protein WC718_17710 [Phycisphaerales bacterium]|jgi:hypothetical protein
MKTTLIATGIALSLAAASQGAIVSVVGQGVQIAPPTNANFPTLLGPLAQCWDEQQNVAISAGVFADITTNPGSSLTPTPGVVVGTFNSHFLHFTGVPAPGFAAGAITFDGPIVAVMFNDTTLDLSDYLGAIGTTYPTGQVGRGLNGQSFVTVLGNTLRFNLFGSTAGAIDIEQVRVLTHPVPAPGALALAGSGLLMFRRRR